MLVKYDVIVIGAGPAGSTAARIASEKGLHVLLIEKERIDREKSCGGFVNKRVFNEFSISDDVIDRKCSGVFLCSPSNNYVTIPHENAGYLVMRGKFDKQLALDAQNKGVEISEETTFIEPLISHGFITGVKVKKNSKILDINSKIVIAADGTLSTFASKLDLYNNDKRLLGFSVQYFMELPEREISSRFDDKIELYFSDFAPGLYSWIFPRRNILSVGLGVASDVIEKKNINLSAQLDKFIIEHPIASKKLVDARIKAKKGHLVGYPGILKEFYGNGFLICGDAAGFVEYTTSEGIYYSMKSGEIAGNIATMAVGNDDLSKHFLIKYKEEIDNSIEGELKESLWIKRRLFSSRRMEDKIVEYANNDEYFKGLMSDFMFESKTGRDYLKDVLRSPHLLLKLLFLILHI